LASTFLRPSAAVGTALALFATVASAQTNGNMLHEWCMSEEEVFQALCAVYVEGVNQGRELGAISAYLDMIPRVVLQLSDESFSEIKSLRVSDLLGYCPPDGATGDQIIDIVKKFLVDNPARRHETASVLVASALNDAFRCAK
jgi:hypothetical protein